MQQFPALGFFPGSLGPTELVIIGIIALLLFGKRLPEVARSLGKGIIEFKKGVQGIEDDVDSASSGSDSYDSSRPVPDDNEEPTAPKFDPPTMNPEEKNPEP